MRDRNSEMMMAYDDNGEFSRYSLPRRPVGYRFKPSDAQLCQLLARKLRGLELPHHHVVEMDVYSREPWLLGDHGNVNWCGEGYYFAQRNTKSIYGNGVTPTRRIGGEVGGGWWRAGVAEKPIKLGDRTVGFKRQLKFYQFKDQTRNRAVCIPTTWIMHEYMLPSKDKFEKWVLCRIKNTSKKPEDTNPEIQRLIQVLLEKLDNHQEDETLSSNQISMEDDEDNQQFFMDLFY